MQSVIELSALAPELQACVHTAVRCGGLVPTRDLTQYVGQHFHPLESARGYSRDTISALVDMRLLEGSAIQVTATDGGIALVNCGHIARTVLPNDSLR